MILVLNYLVVILISFFSSAGGADAADADAVFLRMVRKKRPVKGRVSVYSHRLTALMWREGAQHVLIVLVRTISVVFSSGRPLQLRQICLLVLPPSPICI